MPFLPTRLSPKRKRGRPAPPSLALRAQSSRSSPAALLRPPLAPALRRRLALILRRRRQRSEIDALPRQPYQRLARPDADCRVVVGQALDQLAAPAVLLAADHPDRCQPH